LAARISSSIARFAALRKRLRPARGAFHDIGHARGARGAATAIDKPARFPEGAGKGVAPAPAGAFRRHARRLCSGIVAGSGFHRMETSR
jgi:hypothetical protein